MENQPKSSLLEEEEIRDAISWVNHLSPLELPVIAVAIAGVVHASTSTFEASTISRFLLLLAANISVLEIPNELGLINQENQLNKQAQNQFQLLSKRVEYLEQLLQLRK